MATLTNYTFGSSPGFWSGPFELINVTVPDKPAQPFGMTNVIATQNGSVWKSFRPQSELPIEIASKLNAKPITEEIDNVVGQITKAGYPTQRTSSVLAKIVPWVLVPYFVQRPQSHASTALLISAYFTIHIKTPSPASDADVTIAFYVLPALAKGHLVAPIDGAWVTVSGGWPASQKIADMVGAGAVNAIPTLQKLIDGELAGVSGATFSSFYLLPGKAVKQVGTFFDDADLDVVLALVP